MKALIERYKGRAFVAPSVVERPIEASEKLLAHTWQWIDGAFDVVC